MATTSHRSRTLSRGCQPQNSPCYPYEEHLHPHADSPNSLLPSARGLQAPPGPGTHCAAGRGRGGAAPAPGRCSPSGAGGTGAGTLPSRRPRRGRWRAWPRGAGGTAAAAGSPGPARCRTSPATSPRRPCTCGREGPGQHRGPAPTPGTGSSAPRSLPLAGPELQLPLPFWWKSFAISHRPCVFLIT